MLAVNPVLAAWGQLAAIIICFYILVFVLLALVFNLVMAFGLGWVREKAELIKLLRPSVDSVNKTAEAAMQGVPPDANENAIVRTVSSLPAQMHTLDKKVEGASERVAKGVIEFHARAVQVQTIAKAFFLPGLTKPRARSKAEQDGLQFKSPGYQTLMEQKAPEVPAEPAPGDGYVQTVTASQLKNVASR